MDLEVIDNFLSNDIFTRFKQRVELNEQPWFFLSTPTVLDRLDKKNYSFGCNVVRFKDPELYNPTIPCSKYIKILNESVKNKFSFSSTIRCRLDMTTYRGEQVIFHPHVDLLQQHYTSIFYLTECNAPTIIYNEKHFSEDPIDVSSLTIMNTITPKENRLIVFDGNHIHTGTSATDVSRRILVNSNYI